MGALNGGGGAITIQLHLIGPVRNAIVMAGCSVPVV